MIASRQAQVADACRRFAVERLEVFGSAARGDFKAESSDVDFIARFREPGAPGYADRYFEFAQELERILGHSVDLLTTRSLRNPVFVDRITPDRTVVYAA